MPDAPTTAIAEPAATRVAKSPSETMNGRGQGGIVARGEQQAVAAIASAITELDLSPRPIDLRPLPFEGTWGLATSAAYALANEAVMRDLEAREL